MPMTPKQVLSDPEFYKLGLGDQLSVMRQLDPEFAALDPKTQGEVLYQGHMETTHPARPEETGYGQDPGFLHTLGSDVKGAAVGLMPQNWARTAEGLAQAQIDTAKEAYKDLTRGQYTPATAEALSSLIPVLGPMASQIGNEIANRQWGAASAHLLELFGPELVRGGRAAAATETGTKAGAITRGSLKGGYEGLKKGRAGGAALTAGEIGYAVGGPKGAALGAAAAASPEVIRGAVKGAREELGKLPRKPPPVVPPGIMRQTLAESRRMKPISTEPPPTFQSEPSSGLPSGRRVGPAPPAPEPPVPTRYQAPYATNPSTEPPPPTVKPISGKLPSGRKAGPATSTPLEPPVRYRAPYATGTSVEPPPTVKSIPSSLPSGRRPGPVTGPPEPPPVQRPPEAFSHPAFARLQESIGNKAAAIAAYLREHGIKAETLKALPEDKRGALANEAYEWAKAKGMSIPKSKYRGISDDTLKMITEKLNEVPNK